MNKVFLIIICAIIAAASVCGAALPHKDFSENENRALAQAPKVTFSALLNGETSQQFESYIADRFPLRDALVSAKAVLERASGKKENNGVYFARDKYLIEVPEKVSEETVKKNCASISKMASKGYKSTLFLIPTAFEIMQDKLPDYAYTDIQRQFLKTAAESLNGAEFAAPYDILNKHKDEYIYYRTDHHQTTLGSYYSYLEYCKTMGFSPVSYDEKLLSDSFYGTTWSKAMLPDITPDSICKNALPLPEISVTANGKTIPFYCDEKLKTKDKYAFFMGGNYGTAVIETNVKNGGSVCIVKDSYANAMLPFLVNHYKKIVLVDMRYYNSSVSALLEKENVNEIVYIYNCTNFASDENLIKISL